MDRVERAILPVYMGYALNSTQEYSIMAQLMAQHYGYQVNNNTAFKNGLGYKKQVCGFSQDEQL